MQAQVELQEEVLCSRRSRAPRPSGTRERRIAIARTYVHFACANTALFELMLRHELVDMKHRALVAATARAMRALAGPLADESQSEQLSRGGAIRIGAGWALVHGLAVLVVEKRLRGVVKRAPAFNDLLDFANAVVETVSLKIEAD